ncbi:sugar transferase [Planococcus sp. N064]|uniref:Sugar transferase n=1 Tax=Planococcus liqunii TaxID=3058394 RepID=A0ABT8MNN1_9BACL|nr:sugar transferase [Planococcus sp. N064]MDN7226438.1 sugar transferase [Planococcus sp. N064]
MYKNYFKRVLDFIISLLFMPFLIVIILIVGLVIKIEDRGPAFYSAKRLGKNGSTYKMYKFRTMKVNAPDIRNEDGSTFNAENDTRLLKSGKLLRKLSIDELPQLINVFKGNMSIIGPRPDLPETINMYTKLQRKKLEVKPGITGYTQAYFRNSILQEEKFDFDAEYARNVSFSQDLAILIKTFRTVIFKENVYKGDSYGK